MTPVKASPISSNENDNVASPSGAFDATTGGETLGRMINVGLFFLLSLLLSSFGWCWKVMVGEAAKEGLPARKVERRVLISSFGVTLRDKPSSNMETASLARPVDIVGMSEQTDTIWDHQSINPTTFIVYRRNFFYFSVRFWTYHIVPPMMHKPSSTQQNWLQSHKASYAHKLPVHLVLIHACSVLVEREEQTHECRYEEGRKGK